MITRFANLRVTIAGLGHFGGNIAVAKWLVARGANVLITDKAPADKLADALVQLEGLPITYRLGGHDLRDFTETDLVVASPAIPPTNEYLQAARSTGVPVTTEICLFVERCPAKIVGVTGTKGKSTTSAMLDAILRTRFTTWFGGNIGKSLLDELPNIQPDHIVVLELSSYMLEYLGQMHWSPSVAVLTLLVPDHLDWHGSFEAYANAKMNIFRCQKPGDVAVVNGGVVLSTEYGVRSGSGRQKAEADLRTYAETSSPPFQLQIPGQHNQLNAQGAFAAAASLGVSWEQAAIALKAFPGLPHRLQLVHESAGVRWINDSIATIPEAAVAAMDAFPAGHVIQIVGGADKGLDMSGMIQALAARAKAVLCIGKTGSRIANELRAAGGREIHDCGDLATAVPLAAKLSAPGDIVLLSTGFASYDQFVNFEKRGELFAELARKV